MADYSEVPPRANLYAETTTERRQTLRDEVNELRHLVAKQGEVIEFLLSMRARHDRRITGCESEIGLPTDEEPDAGLEVRHG